MYDVVLVGNEGLIGEIIKKFYGANPIPQSAPEIAKGMIDFGVLIGFDPGSSSFTFHGEASSVART